MKGKEKTLTSTMLLVRMCHSRKKIVDWIFSLGLTLTLQKCINSRRAKKCCYISHCI